MRPFRAWLTRSGVSRGCFLAASAPFAAHNALTRDPAFGLEFLDRFQDKLPFGTDVLRHDQTEAGVPIVPFFRALRADGRLADAAWRKIAWENAIRLLALEPSL